MEGERKHHSRKRVIVEFRTEKRSRINCGEILIHMIAAYGSNFRPLGRKQRTLVKAKHDLTTQNVHLKQILDAGQIHPKQRKR